MKCWSLFFLFVFLSAGSALAHRVVLFAYLENGMIHTEATFHSGEPIMNGKLQVFFQNSNNLLLEGLTDTKGIFSFPLTKAMQNAPSGLKLEVYAGEGHKGEWMIEPDELKSADISKAKKPDTSSDIQSLLLGLAIILGSGVFIKWIQHRRKKL